VSNSTGLAVGAAFATAGFAGFVACVEVPLIELL
jgi:hypothetical protein